MKITLDLTNSQLMLIRNALYKSARLEVSYRNDLNSLPCSSSFPKLNALSDDREADLNELGDTFKDLCYSV
jgi:hypothetical protein